MRWHIAEHARHQVDSVQNLGEFRFPSPNTNKQQETYKTPNMMCILMYTIHCQWHVQLHFRRCSLGFVDPAPSRSNRALIPSPRNRLPNASGSVQNLEGLCNPLGFFFIQHPGERKKTRRLWINFGFGAIFIIYPYCPYVKIGTSEIFSGEG